MLKAYLDDTRLKNIPRLDFNPGGITLYAYHASDENHCWGESKPISNNASPEDMANNRRVEFVKI